MYDSLLEILVQMDTMFTEAVKWQTQLFEHFKQLW